LAHVSWRVGESVWHAWWHRCKCQEAINSVAPTGERQNNTRIYLRGHLYAWLPAVVRALCPSCLSAKIKWEIMLVPQTPDELELRSLQCNPLMGARVFVFISSLSRRIAVCLWSLRIWADKCLRMSSRRNWSLWLCPGNLAAPLRGLWPGRIQRLSTNTLNLVGSAVTRNVKSAFYNWTLRPVSLCKDYIVSKALCGARTASASAIRSATADTLPGVLLVVRRTFLENAVPQSSNFEVQHSQLSLCEVEGGQIRACRACACWTQQGGGAPNHPITPKANWVGPAALLQLLPQQIHNPLLAQSL
jgi:hypothetical protein